MQEVLDSAKSADKQGRNPEHDKAFQRAVAEVKKISANIENLKQNIRTHSKPKTLSTAVETRKQIKDFKKQRATSHA